MRHVKKLAGLLALCAVQGTGFTQTPPTKPNPIETDGTVNVPAFRLPPSVYLSEEAKKALPRRPLDANDMLTQLIEKRRVPATREMMTRGAASMVRKLAEEYRVNYREVTVGGVHGYLITPDKRSGRGKNGNILINLPGGGFIVANAAAGGLQESIPLASRTGFEVLTIDYRQAPEAVFPAASEDVAAVYRELLKTRKASQIGIFGSSAGGLLTAQAIAWFQHVKLPAPGAAGIFCASADARWAGDSWYTFKPMQGLTTPATLDERFYYGNHDLLDPLMSPIMSSDTLRYFPATLLVTSMRAGEVSAAVNTHRELIKAKVKADLHVWDGLDHCFFANRNLPEAQEALDVMTEFFQKNLRK
ncbi:alpha/beta hydrolase [Sphingomonadales bacterium 56]|uniref:alpha/beta hydrolase fold domain-containing protein n=1 Tax=unclassified Sphingobium TaxID=2611147 RepID=UPI001918F2E7|nr:MULTISPECIES: alpha/beta hydrolase fold domain-containing protein [unclassified Sphingobium]MBY2928729.1 alpha/beta hydrolase [Sphingomonadales bacterium 56]MBY2959422.1 alpha/beta hydrolase [Sphingomonadales bacterium 58]CAD7337905.1 Acetyl esterase [Sphingobium sp. S6]CAD7338904.1 Acetyl esterase [Sphingobium sp. S8]